jgi:Ca2+-binding RTX toxin-like protein
MSGLEDMTGTLDAIASHSTSILATDEQETNNGASPQKKNAIPETPLSTTNTATEELPDLSSDNFEPVSENLSLTDDNSINNIANADDRAPSLLSTEQPISEAASSTVRLSSRRIVSGLDQPLFVTSPLGDTERLFILEQKTGEIKILNLNTNTVLSTPFLTINASDLLKNGFEQGLLGLAFHPNYANNGKFYVNYTSPGGGAAGQTKIVEYQVSSNPNIADSTTARTILTYNQPAQNHNGGWMDFGPDGYLYIASGDGGGSGFLPGVPSFAGNAQDITNNLLGKMLRIDVNRDAFPSNPNRNYAAPDSNPFVGKEGDDEIFVYGLRNPWRSSFDRATGDLYIGDVGQNDREEINFKSASSQGGENYGWKLKEGSLIYENPPRPLPSNLVDPIHEYEHSLGRSVIGGYVYRGPVEALQGTYFYGDFTSGKIWSFRYDGTTVSQKSDRTAALAPDQGAINQVASFGEDARGNLYIVDLDGEIFRIEATAASQPSFKISDVTVVEGQSGDANASFTVTLSQSSSLTTTVNYVTNNDTAIAGQDYTSRSGTLTFTPGQTSQTITVPILDNNNIESIETFNIILSNASNATIADSTGVGTIADTLVVSVTTNLPDTIENLRLTGSSAINGRGNNSNNLITGNNSNNILWGWGGNDVIRGEGGADTLYGILGSDTLIGGTGNDTYNVGGPGDIVTENANEGTDTVRSSINFTLSANVENLILTGTANLVANGNAIANRLTGNSGNNTLNGGAGDDTLAGAGGKDRFRFDSLNHGVDRITDFNVADDAIAVSAANFGGGLTAGQSITSTQLRIGVENTATTVDHRFIYNQTSGALFFDRDGNASSFSPVQLAILSSNLELSNSDIIAI